MIRRLYIDNFKCMVNFEFKPASIQLMFGENGTGKTTTFQVLEKLRDCVVSGEPVARLFPPATLTAWQSRPEQTFELEIAGNGKLYSYQLVIEHNRSENKSRIKGEQLHLDGLPLYHYDGQEAHLFRDDHSEGPTFPFDWSRSALATIPERDDNEKLIWFRRRMASVHVFAIDPLRMTSHSDTEQRAPDRGLAEYASWYRHLFQESPKTAALMVQSLARVIDGLEEIRLTKAGEKTPVLKVDFKPADEHSNQLDKYSLPLEEVSEGQRCLIALFAILHFSVTSETTICIDEPDNFVALRELQPWLLELTDRVAEKTGQCLLISHHPEYINQLAAKHGTRFSRTDLGPVRVQPFTWSKGEALLPSEIVARGWDE